MAKRKMHENSLKNLQPVTQVDEEEKRKRSSNGGKKGAETRKKLKSWKEIANIMLSTKANIDQQALLKEYSINDKDADINSMLIYKLIIQGLDGDLNAIRELKEISGNKEAEKIELNTVSQVANDIGDYIGANRTTKKHD